MAVTATGESVLAQAVRSTATAWNLLLAVTIRDIRVRYQGTVLSYLWWVARPLVLAGVLFFALGRVLRLDDPNSGELYIENYGIFLLTGLFPWFWFSGGVQQATGSFISNGGLIKKVRFPRLVLPLSAVFFNTVQFALTLPILMIFMYVADVKPAMAWAAGIPLLIALQVVLIFGLGTLVASLNVFIRDLGPAVDVIMLLMFYTSAVIFPLERVPDTFRPIVQVSPVTTLLEGWRSVLIFGRLPGSELWPAYLGTVVALVLGLSAYRVLERYFADAL